MARFSAGTSRIFSSTPPSAATRQMPLRPSLPDAEVDVAAVAGPAWHVLVENAKLVKLAGVTGLSQGEALRK
jgi:hypothetical protein